MAKSDPEMRSRTSESICAAAAADLSGRPAADAAAELPGLCRPGHPRRPPDLRRPSGGLDANNAFNEEIIVHGYARRSERAGTGLEPAFGDPFRHPDDGDRGRADRRGRGRLFLLRLIGFAAIAVGWAKALLRRATIYPHPNSMSPPPLTLTNSSVALPAKI